MSLFARLKSGTQEQHRELERLIDPLQSFRSLGTYKAYLLKSWGFYRGLEEELAEVHWSTTGLDYPPRQKTALLEEDLQVLKVPLSARTPAQRCLPGSNLDFALGCLYVLEGATLGGQIISRHLGNLNIGPTTGGRFFTGYGPKTGEMWKSFQTTATTYCVSENQINEAVAGANLTFERFRESITALPDSIPA